jgi:L,D-transpeptidase ErfK/SrfK
MKMQNTLCFTLVVFCILSLQGCAGIFPFHLQDPAAIETNIFQIDKNTGVVGVPAKIRLEEGDTLPDIARHFSLGLNAVSAANPDVDVWAPDKGERLLLPLSFVLPDAPRNGIVINLAALRLFHFQENGGLQTVSTFPVGVGTEERPTPVGEMFITRKKRLPTWFVPVSIAADHRAKGDPLPARIPPGPDNPLGEYALYLSEPSYLIHGTNKPASVGLRASNGCIRLLPEDISRLFALTPVKTPVKIVNQPYLVGLRNNVIYLEAHKPFDDLRNTGLKEIYVELSEIEKDTGLELDWDMIEEVVVDATGIPVAVTKPEAGQVESILLRHPESLYGQPRIPPLESNAWYVLAAVRHDREEALRLAAIINHQGPQIPARIVAGGDRYRVLAGPFKDESGAENASHRLSVDLNMSGIIVAP